MSRPNASPPILPKQSRLPSGPLPSTGSIDHDNRLDKTTQWDEEDGEKAFGEKDLPLRTLGEGPVAPVEAAANAKAAVEIESGKGEMVYVEPGLKGWLNLLGVSYSDRLRNGISLTGFQAVLVNSICCELFALCPEPLLTKQTG